MPHKGAVRLSEGAFFLFLLVVVDGTWRQSDQQTSIKTNDRTTQSGEACASRVIVLGRFVSG